MNFKVVGFYSFLSYFIQFCNVVINLILIRTLPLSVLGDISIAKVWMQMMDYSHLGLRFTMDRYVPVWPKAEAEKLLIMCVATSSLVSLVFALFALSFSDSPWLTLAFLVWGYAGATGAILKNYYRGSSDTERMLRVYFVLPGLPALAQSISVFFGLKIFLAATIVSYSIAFFYVFRFCPFAFREGGVDFLYVFRKVRHSSVYLFFNSIVIFLTFSVDRVVLNAVGGKEVLGEYSIVLFVFALMLIVPSSVAEFIFPRVVTAAVQTKRFFFPREMASVLVPTVCAVTFGWLVLPYFVVQFTNYSRLVSLMQGVLLGVIPYAVTSILFHVMSALDMRRELLLASVCCLILYIFALSLVSYMSDELLDCFVVARSAYGYVLAAFYLVFLRFRSVR